MRVLLLHPDDRFDGSWTKQRWDSIVDLGRAPHSFYQQTSATLGCPVFSIYELAVEVGDLQTLRELFGLGMGQVVDRFGIDWWDIISLMLQPELQNVRLAIRLAKGIQGCRTLAVSRPSTTAEAVSTWEFRCKSSIVVSEDAWRLTSCTAVVPSRTWGSCKRDRSSTTNTILFTSGAES
jgi:hypothetical protein